MKLITLTVGTMGNNCYIISSLNGNGLLIDPGAEGELILQKLKDNDIKLKYIFLTHAHFDHIGALREVYNETQAGVIVSEQDAELLSDPEKNVGSRFSADIYPYNLTDITPQRLVTDGDEIILDELTVKVFSTPGHTKGSVVYILNDMLFTGDTLFAGTIGVVTHYGGDLNQEITSVKKLASTLTGEYKVYPGHGALTTLETERRTNPYLGQADYDDCF